MKEYIEREAVLERLAKVDMDTYYGFTAAVQFGVNHAIQCIKEAPAADVVEVRHERWMTTDAYPHHLYCSVCYKTYAKNAKWFNELDLPTNYCPNCGALMEKKEDEHD